MAVPSLRGDNWHEQREHGLAPLEGHPTSKVRVLVDEDPPFVMRDGGRWSGWAIDLWTEVARQVDIEWEIVGEGNADEHLATGRADVGLGDISFTRERATRVDFTQPFFHSGVRILVLRNRPGLLLAAVSALATPAHLLMVVGLLCLDDAHLPPLVRVGITFVGSVQDSTTGRRSSARAA